VLDFMTAAMSWLEGTVYDKVVTCFSSSRSMGERLMEKGDWPNYVDTIRPIYDRKSLQRCSKRRRRTRHAAQVSSCSGPTEIVTSSGDIDFPITMCG